MNTAQSYHNSGMRYVFLFLEEIVGIQECRLFRFMLCSPSLKLFNVQNSEGPPVSNKMHGVRARARRIEQNNPGIFKIP